MSDKTANAVQTLTEFSELVCDRNVYEAYLSHSLSRRFVYDFQYLISSNDRREMKKLNVKRGM